MKFILQNVILPFDDVCSVLVMMLNDEDAVIGSVRITQWNTDTPLLCGVFIGENFRRRGFGEELIRFAVNVCRGAGKPTVSLMVKPKNEAAIALYRKCGFRKFYAWPDEDELLFAMAID